MAILITGELRGSVDTSLKKDYGDWLGKAKEEDLALTLVRLAQLNQPEVYLFWKEKRFRVQ